jgi:RimJ/RimL family protein N-acetyltransferase
MRREGHFLQHGFFKRDGQGNSIWHDGFEYAILSSEWKKEGK